MKNIMMFVIAFTIAGCAGIPLSSMYKMITANPLEFHPDAVSIAIKSSNTIQMNTGDVKMTLFIKSNHPVIKVKQEYFLVVNNGI